MFKKKKKKLEIIRYRIVKIRLRVVECEVDEKSHKDLF